MKDNIMQQYAQKEIITIEDIISFVKQHFSGIKEGDVNAIMVPFEKPYKPDDKRLWDKLGQY